jgi:hypothetical protein
MSVMGMRERGDLAEELLPVAGRLAAIVQGDGGREEVAEFLGRLEPEQLYGLVVVLAGLVDTDRPLGALLGWMDFDEYGRYVKPTVSDPRTLRDLAAEPDPVEDTVDEVAVVAYAEGRRVTVTNEERLQAVIRCAGYGMTYAEIDHMHRLYNGATQKFISRIRRAYEMRGRVFPEMPRPADGRVFTEAEVVDIRTRAESGTSDHVLAVSYDTTPEDIGHICRGRRYPHYGGPVREARRGPARNSRRYWMGDGDSAEYAQAS